MAKGAALMNQAMAGGIRLRPREEVLRFFDGLDLIEP
jgi:hypothetical protein